MSTTTREDILGLIQKLRALGESTTSEAEALVALRKADRLMNSYAISEAELAMAEADGTLAPVEVVSEHLREIEITNGRTRHKVQAVLWQLEQYCEVEVVLKTAWPHDYVHVIGARPDVEMFKFLMVFIRESMDRSFDRWARRQMATGKGAKVSFQTAFAVAVNQRLADMHHERSKERAEAKRDAMALLPEPAREAMERAIADGNLKELTSTALVVVSAAERKTEAVNAAYQAEYASARMGKARSMGTTSSNGNAWRAGHAAGKQVSFGRPVGGSSAGRIAQ